MLSHFRGCEQVLAAAPGFFLPQLMLRGGLLIINIVDYPTYMDL